MLTCANYHEENQHTADFCNLFTPLDTAISFVGGFPGRNGSNTIYRVLRPDNWSSDEYIDNILVKGLCITHAHSAPTQMLVP